MTCPNPTASHEGVGLSQLHLQTRAPVLFPAQPGLPSSRPFYQTPLTGLPRPGHSDRDTNEGSENLRRQIFFSPVNASRKETVCLQPVSWGATWHAGMKLAQRRTEPCHRKEATESSQSCLSLDPTLSKAGICDLLSGMSQEFPLLGINQFRLDGCHWQPTSFHIIARTCCSPYWDDFYYLTPFRAPCTHRPSDQHVPYFCCIISRLVGRFVLSCFSSLIYVYA